MAWYIDKDLLFKTIDKNVCVFDSSQIDIKEQCLSHINEAPIAKVVEVKHGTWNKGTEPSGSVYAHCSACNRKMNYSCYGYAYCALCGARMDGRSETNAD